MKRFKNILVVVPEVTDAINNPALKRGFDLAQKNKGRLTLMAVISPPTTAISEMKGIFKPEELTTMLVNRRKESLGKVVNQLGGNIEIDIKVAVGRDFIEVVRQVVTEDHDLLIKVANAHSESFDSSDFHLMRKCPQPVWLIKDERPATTHKILAAVDLSLERDSEGSTMNTLIMDLATSLAQWENSQLHVLSCWSLYGENTLRNSSFIKISEEEINKLLKEEEQANQKLLNELAKRYDGFNIETHLIKGNPVDHIPLFSKDNDIEVVVMGTVARSGIPGLLIGNTSETILNLLDASVITVKPGGFKSIIE